MGFSQTSSRNGYSETYLTNKYAYNFVIKGYSATPVNGAIRLNTLTDPDTLEIYMRDTQWFTLIYDLTVYLGKFYHTPFAIGQYILVHNGMSIELGVNGYPKFNEYDMSMGACPPLKDIDGGTW